MAAGDVATYNAEDEVSSDEKDPGAAVAEMQRWLRERKEPVYGTKGEMWKRILQRNFRDIRDEAIQTSLRRQLEERQEGQPDLPVMPVGTP